VKLGKRVLADCIGRPTPNPVALTVGLNNFERPFPTCSRTRHWDWRFPCCRPVPEHHQFCRVNHWPAGACRIPPRLLILWSEMAIWTRRLPTAQNAFDLILYDTNHQPWDWRDAPCGENLDGIALVVGR